MVILPLKTGGASTRAVTAPTQVPPCGEQGTAIAAAGTKPGLRRPGATAVSAAAPRSPQKVLGTHHRPTPHEGFAAVPEVASCCERLRELRGEVSPTRCTRQRQPLGGGNGRGALATGAAADATVLEALQILRHLERLTVSRQLLQLTGVGREVNHAFFRRHEDPELRMLSVALVRSWKASLGFGPRGPAENAGSAAAHDAACDASAGSRKRPRVQTPGVDTVWRQGFFPVDAATATDSPSFRATKPDVGRPTASAGFADPGQWCATTQGVGGLTSQAEVCHRSPFHPGRGADEERPSASHVTRRGTHATADLSVLSVKELKARVVQAGLDAAMCTEKSDLVELLVNARGSGANQRAGPKVSAAAEDSALFVAAPRSQTGCRRSRLSTGRQSVGRLSLLRSKAPDVSRAKGGEMIRQRQRDEIRRIALAKDDRSILGMDRGDAVSRRNKGHKAAVLQQFRSISRVVHPDKCPADLREAATRAFQRLECARDREMLVLKSARHLVAGGS